MHMTYVALHEVTWCMIVWCTQNEPKWQQLHVAPAMPAPLSTPLQWILKKQKICYEKLVTHAESHASTVSLLESEEYSAI